jgi:hypothetical protein
MSTASEPSRARPWKRRLMWTGVLIVTLGLVGLGVFSGLAMQWTEITSADLATATATLQAQRDALGSAPPYLDRDDQGRDFLHHELEQAEGQDLSTLHAMVWVAPREKLVHVTMPMWFVRAKDIGGNGLSMFLAAADRDLGDLDLELDVAALERRGPGLLLDRNLPNGTTFLVWSED